MGNTAKGARRAVRTKKAKYGSDVMKKQGSKGGQATRKRWQELTDPTRW